MKLDNKEFKRFKELASKAKSSKLTSQEQAELDALTAKRNERGSNSIEWWNNYPALLKDVTNVAFNYIPGTKFPLVIGGAKANVHFGNIAVAKFVSAIGKSQTDSDAFNAQIRQLWLDLHRKYRGIGTYEKADLGMCILAVNEVFKTLAKFERIYGVINTYHIGNRIIPYGLKQALGISDDLEINLADFRYTLNLFVQKIRQLCLPKGLSALEADIVVLSNIFKDSANRRASLFCFDSESFGIYEPTIGFNAGGVRFERFDEHMHASTSSGTYAFTLSDVNEILSMQVNALLNDEDIARICSDLIAAYGAENVMTMIDVPDNYKIEPVQDYERSVQFHNLTIMGGVGVAYEAGISGDTQLDAAWLSEFVTGRNKYVIYQKDNIIKCSMYLFSGASYYLNAGTNIYEPIVNASDIKPVYGDVLFDTWVDEPGPVELMCGTRFTSIAGGVAIGSNSHIALSTYGTCVVTVLQVFYYDTDDEDTYAYTSISGQMDTAAAGFNAICSQTVHLRNVDWAPLFYDYRNNYVNVLGDVDNFTRLSDVTLSRMHDVAILSGFKFNCVTE